VVVGWSRATAATTARRFWGAGGGGSGGTESLSDLVVEALLEALDEIFRAGHVDGGLEVLKAGLLVVELGDLGVEHLQGGSGGLGVDAVAEPDSAEEGVCQF
jgi:hypothetical protein